MTAINGSAPTGSKPLWTSEGVQTAGALTSNLTVDVCIIGAGIAGLTTAYRCLADGKSVAIVEKGQIGSGETLRSSAHLASALDDRFEYLERRHGEKGARLLAQSHQDAIDWMERLCTLENIACDFERVPGYLYPTTGDATFLREELHAATRAGLVAEIVDAPTFGCGKPSPSLRFEHQAAFDLGKYLAGLAQAVLKLGGEIYTNSFVANVIAGQPAKVVLRGGNEVLARHVVVATNVPITSGLSLPLRQAAYRSYVLVVPVEKASVERALHWDNEDPYHYVRIANSDLPERDLLIVGGEDHKTGQEAHPERCFERLEAWLRKRYPEAGGVLYHWSGQIMEPIDGVGFVGLSPGMGANVYMITGDSGHGLTLGTLGAKIVADAIAERQNEWSKVFDPERSVLPVLSTFLKENVNVAAQYLDYFQSGDVTSEADVPKGEGGLVRDGLSLRAVYCDTEGVCHVTSAICPHLGGVLQWNASEKTWDCPAHGSRFDALGTVITGPATTDLIKIARNTGAEP